jgi:GxxExxY protein
MDTDTHGYDTLTEKILGAAFEVMNTLGPGFSEKVYERALVLELQLRGVKAMQQASLSVFYKGQRVGDYFADLLVEDEIVVELKVADTLAKEHVGQCLNYLKASNRQVCLLINFQNPRLEWKRVLNTPA